VGPVLADRHTMTSHRKVERKVAPGIWKLNKNAFAIRVQVVDPQTGRRKNLKRTLRNGTLPEAKQVRQQLLTHYDGRTPSEPGQPAPQEWAPPAMDTNHVQPWVSARAKTARVTLGDFAESWLERKIRRGDLQRLTQDRYAVALDRLSPSLQRTLIGDVMPADIERWMVAALREYAPTTINSWRRVLRTVYNDARHQLGLLVNPVDVVKPLRVSVNLEEPNAVSSSELRRLLEAVRAHTTDSMREHYSTVSAPEARDAADRVAALVFSGDTGSDRQSARVEFSAAE